MTNKPNSIEELKAWLAEHAADGRINDEAVIKLKPERVEFRGGFINGELYDLLILRAAAFSYSKSDLMQHSFILFLEQTRSLPVKLWKPTITNARSEYRGFLPGSLYETVMTTKENLGFSNADLLTVAGQMFVNSRLVDDLYHEFVYEITQKHNCSTSDVEQAIFDAARLKARKRRLAISTEKGEFINDAKIAD